MSAASLPSRSTRSSGPQTMQGATKQRSVKNNISAVIAILREGRQDKSCGGTTNHWTRQDAQTESIRQTDSQHIKRR